MKRASLLPAFAFFIFVLLIGVFAPHTIFAQTCTWGLNGDKTVSTSCSVAADTVKGVDWTTGENSVNSAVLTIDSAASFTILSGVSGTTQVVAGSVVINSGGSLIVGSANAEMLIGTGLWVDDADADGYSNNISVKYTATASGRRRQALMRENTADCDDGAYSTTNTCYSYGQGYYYAYGQGYYYAYGQGYYYGYGQGYYYGYGQSGYWGYGYGQGYYYGYGQSMYWSYGYGQSSYCFLEGTKIHMADGSTKDIKDVKPGDMVITYDLQKDTKAIGVVQEHLTFSNEDGYYIINDTLRVTGKHPIWNVDSQSWILVEDVHVGDALLGTNGQEINVTTINFVHENQTVYSLHLNAEPHNFFADGILVHNFVSKY